LSSFRLLCLLKLLFTNDAAVVAEEGETIDLLSAAPPAVMYVEAPTGLYYGAACFTGTYCGCMVLYVKA